MMNYFLYQHIRKDNNEIFYIGIGTKPKVYTKGTLTEYKRAYSKSNRNFLWKKIVNITDYIVVILNEFDCLEEALKAETNLINFYGRIITGTGKLTNLIASENEREALRMKNLYLSIEKSKIKVYKYSKEGEFICEYQSITDAAIDNKTLPSDISLATKRKRILVAGFQWRLTKMQKIEDSKNLYKKRAIMIRKAKNKTILQYDLDGNFIKEWKSTKDICEKFNIKGSALRNVLSSKVETKTSKGYFWKYKDDDKVCMKEKILNVYDLEMNFIDNYFTLADAEIALNLSKNTISCYLQRNKPHFKFIFEEIKERKKKECRKKRI